MTASFSLSRMLVCLYLVWSAAAWAQSPDVVIYRFVTGHTSANHTINRLYTTDPNGEGSGWHPEGVLGACFSEKAKPNDAVPLYRLRSDFFEDHFYTTDAAEREQAAHNTYVKEGVPCYVYTYQAPRTCPVYRLFIPGNENWDSPNNQDHLYTMSSRERDAAISGSADHPNDELSFKYHYEGIAGYMYPYNQPNCP